MELQVLQGHQVQVELAVLQERQVQAVLMEYRQDKYTFLMKVLILTFQVIKNYL